VKSGTAAHGRRAHVVVVGLSVLLGVAACEAHNTETSEPAPAPAVPSSAGGPRAPFDERETAPGASATPDPVPVAPSKPPDLRPTIGKHLGEIGGPPLEAGAKLKQDAAVMLAAGASLDLTFPGGASVRVLGPARVAVPAGPAGLLLGLGTVSVDLELTALHPGSGFWLTTPSARIELVHGARFVARTFQDRSSEITAVSGVLGLTTLDSHTKGRASGDNAQELTTTRLAAGNRASIGAEGQSRITPAAAVQPGQARVAVVHLQTEERRLEGLPERRPVARVPEGTLRLEKGGATLQSSVEAALEQVAVGLTRERELQSRHRTLLAQKDAQAMQVQRELAQQGAQTFAARRSLEKRLSLFEADNLAQGKEGLSSPLIARARELLR
jgi:hypothetical protein